LLRLKRSSSLHCMYSALVKTEYLFFDWLNNFVSADEWKEDFFASKWETPSVFSPPAMKREKKWDEITFWGNAHCIVKIQAGNGGRQCWGEHKSLPPPWVTEANCGRNFGCHGRSCNRKWSTESHPKSQPKVT
jgi:hypothetical protein